MDIQVYKHDKKFILESGKSLSGLQIAYSTFGRMNAERTNVVWVCHALTANSNPEEWWRGLVGDSCLFNPDEYFIVCANILGSCYGSSSPVTINPITENLYYTDFPQITIRDMVKVHDVLREYLGIKDIYTCIGGSMGGQQAMEWAILQPTLIKNLILVATNANHSAWGIAFNEAQRLAIQADHTWNERRLNAGKDGLKAARAIALLSYRNYETYQNTQSESGNDKLDDFRASSYQQYQGQKLIDRFNVLSYFLLTKAMDSHNVGRGRGSIERALRQIKANTLVVGIRSDVLFPPAEQMFLARHISRAKYLEIDSPYGHDGFLVETEQLTEILEGFLKKERLTATYYD